MNGQEMRDDLTEIKGIGQAREKWLSETFGISSFTELAALTVDEIETALKASGKVSSRLEIESWIAQAQTLAVTNAAAQPAEAEREEGESIAGSRSTQFIARQETLNPAPLARGAWQPVASFVVEFQSRNGRGTTAEWRTVIHYMEEDIGTNWPGLETEQLCHWIKQQADFLKPVESIPPALAPQTETAATTTSPVNLQIREIRLVQSPDYSQSIESSMLGRTFLGHVDSKKPVTLEVAIELSGPPNSPAMAAFNYRAQCLLHNLSTRNRPDLFDMEVHPLAGGGSLYQIQLADISLESGMYKLGVLLKGRTPFSANYFELPRLNVL